MVGIYLTQVMLIAGIGILAGLAIGAVLPFALDAAFGALLPLPLNPTLAPGELVVAALYGALTALAFAIGPLGRAHDVAVSGLFRDTVDPDRRWPRPLYLGILSLALAGFEQLPTDKEEPGQ